MTADLPFIDVETKRALPDPPVGQRYLDFLGGSRELRCFLVDRSLPRSDFMRNFPDLLDEALEPIYRYDGVVVRQDCSWALPGFYIVSPDTEFAALDLMPRDQYQTLSAAIHRTRAAMRSELGIEHIHLHYEEKDEESCTVHFWLLPIPSQRGVEDTLLTHLDLHAYLGQFSFRSNRSQIVDWNARMRRALQR